MEKTYKINGMNCAHCKASVEKAISGIRGVEKVEVNLKEGMATVSGEHKDEEIIEAVTLAGFEIEI